MNSFKGIIQTNEIKGAIVHFLKNAKDKNHLKSMLQTNAFVWGTSMEIKKEIDTLKERIKYLFYFVKQHS